MTRLVVRLSRFTARTAALGLIGTGFLLPGGVAIHMNTDAPTVPCPCPTVEQLMVHEYAEGALGWKTAESDGGPDPDDDGPAGRQQEGKRPD